MTRLDSLTGLRFFAALLVFGRHVDFVGPLDADNALSAGFVGVSFFFILSGFVLAWSAQPGRGAGDFWQRRLARVYPAYFVAWVVALAVLIASGASAGFEDILSLTLLQSWFPDPDIYFATSPVFWSLSCEALFYLSFPLGFPLLARMSSRGRLVLAGVLVAAVFVIAIALHPMVDDSVGKWFGVVFPPVRMLEFVLGMVLALEVKRLPRVPLVPAVVLSVVAVGLAGVVPLSFMRVAVTLVPFALLIVAAAQADIHGARSVFRSRVLVLLGVWSYAFYLTHTTVLSIYNEGLRRVFGTEFESAGTALTVVHIAVCLGLAIVAAWLLHVCVERPMEARLRPRGARANVVAAS